jgi:hypothetical protein
MTKALRSLPALAVAVVMMCATVNAQSIGCPDQGRWNTFTFPPANGAIDAPLLLTDGRVMAQYVGTAGNPHQDWWALTPDPATGYATTNPNNWSELASLHGLWNPEYGPYGFASAVLADGRVLVEGGEHNITGPADTDMGALYVPASNGPGSWSQLQPPPGWNGIGDAASVVLPNKTYMVAGCCGEGNEQGQLNPSTLNWTVLSNNGKQGGFFEEGWTLLPGITGGILTVDTGANNQGQNLYEIFSTSTNSWTNGIIPVQLYGNFPSADEIGPAIQLMDGTIFATGASEQPNPLYPTEPGNTAIYNPSSGWTQGPTFPVVSIAGVGNEPTGMGDEMAVLLPDGNVLMAVHSQPDHGANYYFMEYQPATINALCPVSGAPSALTQNTQSNGIRMLVLPTGQVFVTHYDYGSLNPSSAYYIYTPPTPTTINSNWQPSISSVSSSLTRGTTYQIFGYRFNGLSQANQFGDDFQNATNYPIIRITNNSTGHVFYAKTHDHSTMAISTGTSPTFTSFEVSPATETGASTLVVIANGIVSSNSASVTIN